MKDALRLFGAFFKIGLFLFGGGFAMLPLLERDVVEKHRWATKEEILDYFAIGQCTPGIIAVNTATLVGYKQKGFLGSLFATIGVVTPSLIIITLIAAFLSNFQEIPAVAHAFAGVRAAVAALILSAMVKLFRSNVLQKRAKGESTRALLLRNLPPVLLAAAGFVVIAFLGLSPIYVVIGAALAGILLYGKRGGA